ncbi:MAG TPA: Hpt domain-containing protein [Xanthobacteraceae bacterium]|nr:Hpt domain-containing protein [Xanthobacteraceae bacterium]
MVKSPIQQAEETKFSDHTVIVPPHRLKAVITHTPEQGDIAMDVVARAEAALAEIKHEFRSWMSAECDALEAARNEMRAAGLSKPVLKKIGDAAHEIKGHAAVLGFPLAGRIANSLCRLLNHAPQPGLVPITVIESHVDAIRAVVREQIHNANDKTGKEIFERLAAIVENFLAKELGDAYAEIAGDSAFALPKQSAKPRG